MARRSNFSAKLASLGPAVVREVEQHMYAAGDIIRVAAQISITTGAVSGKHHVASLPGEAPNNDTKHLADGIEVARAGRLQVLITSTAKYSAALEYGTSKMAARPFMGPAAEANRLKVNKKLGQHARRAIRQHFKR